MSKEGKKGKVLVENRTLVVPGDVVAEGDVDIQTPHYLIKMGDKVVATVIGLVNIENENKLGLIPLEGTYVPKVNDLVIGIVTDIGITYWELDIKAPYPAILYASDMLNRPVNVAQENLADYLNIGDVVVAKVSVYDRTRNPILTVKGKGLGKVPKGVLVEVNPSRVPRIIGKKGSMINMLISESKCEIIVGQNGRIVINCPNPEMENIVVMAIRKIEREAHISGLTERVRQFILEEKVKRGLISGTEYKLNKKEK